MILKLLQASCRATIIPSTKSLTRPRIMNNRRISLILIIDMEVKISEQIKIRPNRLEQLAVTSISTNNNSINSTKERLKNKKMLTKIRIWKMSFNSDKIKTVNTNKPMLENWPDPIFIILGKLQMSEVFRKVIKTNRNKDKAKTKIKSKESTRITT